MVPVKESRKAAFDPKIFLAKVGDGKTISKYQKDQIVFSQGDVADAVFYIQKGKIKLTVVSERGKEAVVRILEPSHFFGEGCLNGHPLRVTTATAIEQSLITCIPKAAMIATLHDEVEFSELFMADLLNRTVELKRTSSINYSIQARNGWRESFCFWRISARKPRLSRSSGSLVRKPSRR